MIILNQRNILCKNIEFTLPLLFLEEVLKTFGDTAENLEVLQNSVRLHSLMHVEKHIPFQAL